MAELDQINASTRRYVRARPKLIDMVFQEDPLLAYLKRNVNETFTGGSRIDEPFIYDGLNGGPYAKGATFDITEKQIEQVGQFNVRLFYTNVTLSKEDVQVFNKGPQALFKLIDSRMQAGYMTMGANLALAQYLPGSGTNYTNNFNGLPEALNDNSTASWNGSTYSTYGTITRGGTTGTALSSVPVNVAGPVQYSTLEENYGEACYGSVEPNLIVTTVKCKSFIKERFQPQQRFNNTVNADIGFRGLEFNGATLISSRYCPGSYLFGPSAAGTADPVAVTFMTKMSGGALTSYPLGTGYSSGNWETLWILNARKPYIQFYISDDAEFGLGFSGFKPGRDDNQISGQIFFAGAMTFAPRYHKQLYGITG